MVYGLGFGEMTNKNIPMRCYYDLLRDILENDNDSEDRTRVGTKSVFGRQLRFDLSEGFPLLPGKFTPFKLVAAELLWFISGSTNNEDLRKLNGNDRPTIWEEWQNERSSLGPIYGRQWRYWNQSQYSQRVDQISELIEGLTVMPSSRRLIVSAWNASDLPNELQSPQENVNDGYMALAPCHFAFQMRTRKLSISERICHYERTIGKDENKLSKAVCRFDELMDELDVPKLGLSCHVNIRSSDTFLGLPFNIASYALLTHMIAQVVNMTVDELIVTLGDAHIYSNHINQVSELLSRDHTVHALPKLKVNPDVKSIDDFKMSDLEVIDYQSHPAISAPVAI